MQVVSYSLDDGTLVCFEVESLEGFRPAGPDEVVGKLRDAVEPVVDGAKLILDKMKKIAPDQIEIKFGVKASGTMNWLIARAASEGNLEVTLTWRAEGAPTS